MMSEEQVSHTPSELLPVQIEMLDGRVKQVEKIAETIESIAKDGIAAATKYLESKAETERMDAEAKDAQHQREVELHDKQHKRSVFVLILIFSAIFVLVTIAMLMKQFDFAKIILGSSLAVAGGAGISNLFRPRALTSESRN